MLELKKKTLSEETKKTSESASDMIQILVLDREI